MPKATPIIAVSMTTGEQFRFRTLISTEVEGFDPAKVWLVANGVRTQHAGFTFHYEGKEARPGMTMREYGRKKARAIRGVGPKGEEILLRGRQDITEAGFVPQSVYNTALGKAAHHHGWKFEYINDEPLKHGDPHNAAT